MEQTWKQRRQGSPAFIMCKGLKDTKVALRKWNREVFGVIQYKISQLRTALDVIQQKPDDDIAVATERELRGQLLEQLKREEILWRNKSRVTWLTTPYLNTKFVYISTIIWRRRNCIDAIKNPNGMWLQERDHIGHHFISHFQHLFERQQTSFPRGFAGLFQEVISSEDNELLCAAPEEAEISTVVKSLGPTKAPGPDGFSAISFQQFWRIIKLEVVSMVKKFFQTGFLLMEFNHTNITLIPNIESPTLVTHYRPISLYNVAYKIIAKLLANRLQLVIHKILSHSQSAFVLGRRIQDNIILVNEIMHTLKKKRGRGSLMALKIDIEKAYDKVDWGFLLEIMRCCVFFLSGAK